MSGSISSEDLTTVSSEEFDGPKIWLPRAIEKRKSSKSRRVSKVLRFYSIFFRNRRKIQFGSVSLHSEESRREES
ncbi:hypothetical protein SUGI_0100750 [Cryptomeria japonica]|nr:hypothetical protein SUGI_0100750 [Cryptomeria japonica]